MKSIVAIAFILFFTSCEKASDDSVVNYDGVYKGTLSYALSGKAVAIPATRTIEGDVSTWWVVPACSSAFKPEAGTYAVNAVLQDSTLCSGVVQMWVFEFVGSGVISSKTITESGDMTYRYYIAGVLVDRQVSDWRYDGVR